MEELSDGVTVLVPTVGRPAALRRLAAGLAGLEDPGAPWSVLIVDNGSRRTVDRRTFADVGAPVRLVHEPRGGASHARNTGIDHADTEWTALLDDDVVPDPDWLRALLQGSLQHGFDLAGGRVRLDPAVPLPRWFDPSLGGFIAALDLGDEPRRLDDEYLLTANAIGRTELLRSLRFDPRLGPRPGSHLTNDDLDLVRRARAAGAVLGWLPDAAVTHDVPAERLRPAWLLRRAYHQGRSDRRLHHEEAAHARFGGVRAGWWYLRERIPHWWRHRRRFDGFVVRAIVELVRTLGWWRECLAARERRYGQPL